jgi:putative transposase
LVAKFPKSTLVGLREATSVGDLIAVKNPILLEHYYLPGDLERQVAAFVAHYNHARYHESLDNLTPADVYFGRAEAVLLERERIKRQTIANRRSQHQLHAA